jgi:hypothetical protein
MTPWGRKAVLKIRYFDTVSHDAVEAGVMLKV